jgi:hypothetical protein
VKSSWCGDGSKVCSNSENVAERGSGDGKRGIFILNFWSLKTEWGAYQASGLVRQFERKLSTV